MSKTGLLVTSLVAAVPGGFLCYLLVMAFLSHAEDMATMLMVVCGMTLLTVATVALAPVGILLFSPSTAAPAKKKDKKSKKAAEDEAADEESGEIDEADIEDEAELLDDGEDAGGDDGDQLLGTTPAAGDDEDVFETEASDDDFFDNLDLDLDEDEQK